MAHLQFALDRVLIGAIGRLGYLEACEWFFRHKKYALRRFWNISPKSLLEHSSTEHLAPNSGDENSSANLSHVRSVHSLEVQSSLIYDRKLEGSKAQIRLLHIRAAAREDENIICTLRHADIQDGDDYTALSYRWGSTLDPQNIILNDRMVQVTQNLYNALKELRNRNIRLVWVDALCINQTDVIEQAQQIGKMTLIYSRAQSVFAWLGDDDPHFFELKQTLDRLGEFKSNEGFDSKVLTHSGILADLYRMWIGKPTGDTALSNATLLETELPIINAVLKRLHPSLAEFDRLLHAKQLRFLELLCLVVSNEYWRRAWILQELTVAGKIQLSCGKNDIDFDQLCEIIQELEALASDRIFPGFTPNHRHIFNIFSLRRKWQPREPIHMFTALQKSYDTLATEERDKVYSLLGVCYDSSRFLNDIDEKLPIDTILKRMTETSIKSTKTLDVICVQSSFPRPRSSLPSWAPDWLFLGGDPFLDQPIKYLTGHDEHPKYGLGDNYWHATAHSRLDRCSLFDGGKVLKVRGECIGFIKSLSGVDGGDLTTYPLSNDASKNPIVGWAHNNLTDLEPSVRYLAADIFDALTIYKRENAVDDEGCIFGDLWKQRTNERLRKKARSSYEWLRSHQNFRIHGYPLQLWGRGTRSRTDIKKRALSQLHRIGHHNFTASDPSSGSIESHFNERVDKLADAVVRVLKDGLRLMGGDPLFDKSRPLTGWAHPRAQLDDHIYLLQGCSMPIILRPYNTDSQHQPSYSIIGEAHVVGAMYGKLWTGTDKSLQDIYLH
ncbi:uncharacterized protein KY384_000758 [Bacidia gigantensis]|uniref:uncharacterized protein n=1 Tax=Bacidia gigantensis TaxID=2732470 RepID=UPI001D0362AC|nr:uncharacterized protein KY384_000758 [Bacidia gigantensis]KAG8525996.1 hypothetical protein KY384_000758 [Bacidia gigantensis]